MTASVAAFDKHQRLERLLGVMRETQRMLAQRLRTPSVLCGTPDDVLLDSSRQARTDAQHLLDELDASQSKDAVLELREFCDHVHMPSLAEVEIIVDRVRYFWHTRAELPEVEAWKATPSVRSIADATDTAAWEHYVSNFHNAFDACESVAVITGCAELSRDDARVFAQRACYKLEACYAQSGNLRECLSVWVDIVSGRMACHVPQKTCSVCFVTSLRAVPCHAQECEEALCDDCCLAGLKILRDDSWTDLDAMRSSAAFACVDRACAGNFRGVLNYSGPEHQALYGELLQQLGRAAERAEHTAARHAQLQTDVSKTFSKLVYAKIFEAVEEQVTPKCPYCHIKFSSFNACCSITCVCGRRFCAICLQGDDRWRTESDTHPHIHECGQGVPGFDGLYMSIDHWHAHMQRRRTKWLAKNMQASWPNWVKDKLRLHFH
jgi:hypothetical protein